MTSYTRRLWALLMGIWIWEAGQASAQPPNARPLSAALLWPAGRAGLVALLGGDDQELSQRVRSAVTRRGFYADGRPSEAVGVGDCAGCHADVARQWAGSAHRFASFNNPYYAASVDALQRERPPQQARFCASCHDPLLLVDDRITAGVVDRTQPAAQAGLTCLVCHSIESVQDLRGNGNYVLRADPVPPPLGGAVAQQVSPHRQRLRPALLATAEFCAACHKVGLPPEITGDQWLRGQNDYDAWQQSMAGGNGVAAIYRPPGGKGPRVCQDCHMPPEPGAGGHLVRSHRFLAANTALPALREDADQQARTAAMLREAVSLDLAVLRGGAAGQAEPTFAGVVDITGAAQVTLDVVLRNRRVGHRFPGGTGDSNQVWLEVEASSGGKLLRDAAHVLRPQAVDEQAQPLLRRDVQHLRGVIYDTSLSPADPQVVRYGLDLADLAGPEVTVRARLRYRKFTPEYAAFACADLPAGEARGRCEQPPIVDVAEATRVLRSGDHQPLDAPAPAAGPPLWERYLDHGLGLADGLVERSGEALPSLLRAAALRPDRAEPLLGLGRLYLAQARTAEVLLACEQAQRLAPEHPAAQWLRAQALYRTYQWKAALPYLERAHQLLPGDRNVLGLLARVRGLLGDARGALEVADQLLRIDPESEDGHYQRMLALRELRRADEAVEAERRYLYYRRPTERDQSLRARFRHHRPDLADEDTLAHFHRLR